MAQRPCRKDQAASTADDSRQNRRWRQAACLGMICLLAGACSSDENPLEQIEKPVEQLYNEALNEATSGDIGLAAPLFDEVERQHPYSKWATRAQLMSAWALYQSNKYPEAIMALDRFIELNPAHEDAAYAYYLKAQSYYEQIVDVERDAEMTRKAGDAFETLLQRYPDSDYARDAKLKLDLTRSHLAGKQMAVGRFYLKRGYYDAALRRFERVITDYQTSNQVPEALFRMVEAYLALGLDTDATRSGAVLQYNYPDSIWTSRMLRLVDMPEKNHEPGMLRSLMDKATALF